MASSVTLPLGGAVKVFAKGRSEGRAVSEYVDGKRVEGSHAKNDRGEKLYRHTVLIAVTDEADPEDAALTTPTETIEAKRFDELTLKPGAEVTIRAASAGEKFAELRFSVSGEVAASPSTKKSDF